jgi:fatty-acyl-CoA synthase
VATAELERGRDVGVSWLPLYHDMGLIGLLAAPMTTGMDLALAAPQDFLAAPARWMEWMSAFRGTATAGPNFAYALAARALRRLEGLDLSAWRIAINGAEPIDPKSVEAFVEAGALHGLAPGTTLAAFGMAEATLAVTFATPGKGLEVDVVDGRVLEGDRYAAPAAADQPGARALARLGRPLSNLRLRICDTTTGVRMQEREVGEIEIRGASVTPGYYGRPGATADAFHEGWLRTGDLGCKGRESLVVVAETRDEADATVSDEIAARVRATVGIPPSDVVLVRSGTLPKTSSGKLQRTLCRERYLTEALELH